MAPTLCVLYTNDLTNILDQGYVCNDRHCLWENYIENEDWGYYSTNNGDCKLCQSKCTADSNCIGVECGENIDYCSWWKRGRCVKDSEQTEEGLNHTTCIKTDGN